MILQIKPFIGLSVLFLSVFFSCGQTKKTEGLEVIPIEAAYLHPTTLNLIKLQVASLARSDISGMIRKVASRFSAG